MMQPAEVEEILKKSFPEARLRVEDMTGTGDHFLIVIASDRFKGKGLIEQHQAVYAALDKEMNNRIHAVKIKTMTLT